MTEEEATRCSPLRLAYVGDTIWDLLIRTKLFLESFNLHHMHEMAVQSVNAHAQMLVYRKIEPFLSEKELVIAKRGRNAHVKHGIPKHQTHDDYLAATALETLFGYLYLTGQNERIRTLFRLGLLQETKEEEPCQR